MPCLPFWSVGWWLSFCRMTVLFSICLFSGFWKSELEVSTGFEDICIKCTAQSKHHIPYLPDSKEGKVWSLVWCPFTVIRLEIFACFPLVNIFTFLIHVLCLATKSSLTPCGLLEYSEYIMIPGWERVYWQLKVLIE